LTTPNINGLKTRIALMFGNGTYFINPKDKEQAHIRFFSVKTIKELMELHGFKTISLTPAMRGTITYIGEKKE